MLSVSNLREFIHRWWDSQNWLYIMTDMSEPRASFTVLSDLICFFAKFFPTFPFSYFHQHKNLCFCIVALQERYIISHSTYTDKTCCWSVTKSCPLIVTPWTVACQVSLSFTLSWSLFKLMSIELVMPSNYLVLCHPLLFLPSIFSKSGSFPMNQLFSSGDQIIGTSASAQSFQLISRVDVL